MDFIEFLESQSNSNPRPKSSAIALTCGAFVGGLGIVTTVASIPFLLPYFRRICLPYVPATTKQVQNVIQALEGRTGKVIDLGSGDGRIVLAAAKSGFDSTGIELNPWLVLYSKAASMFSGLQNKPRFHRSDLWTFSLKPYKNIVIFGVDNMMLDLEKKFLKELDKGSQIVACRFPLPNIKPIKTLGMGIDKVWIYEC